MMNLMNAFKSRQPRFTTVAQNAVKVGMNRTATLLVGAAVYGIGGPLVVLEPITNKVIETVNIGLTMLDEAAAALDVETAKANALLAAKKPVTIVGHSN